MLKATQYRLLSDYSFVKACHNSIKENHRFVLIEIEQNMDPAHDNILYLIEIGIFPLYI